MRNRTWHVSSLRVSGCGHRQVYATADDMRPTRTHVQASRLEFREERREWLGGAANQEIETPPAPADPPGGPWPWRRIRGRPHPGRPRPHQGTAHPG